MPSHHLFWCFCTLAFQFTLHLHQSIAFITNLHSWILEKRSHRNKGTATCYLWLLLRRTCLRTAFIYICIERFAHLKQSLTTTPYQSTAWLAFPGLQWKREQGTQLCKKYYVNESSLTGCIDQCGLKQLNSNTIYDIIANAVCVPRELELPFNVVVKLYHVDF